MKTHIQTYFRWPGNKALEWIDIDLILIPLLMDEELMWGNNSMKSAHFQVSMTLWPVRPSQSSVVLAYDWHLHGKLSNTVSARVTIFTQTQHRKDRSPIDGLFMFLKAFRLVLDHLHHTSGRETVALQLTQHIPYPALFYTAIRLPDTRS